jgi:signal transduction histidine kinase/ligand-binding sensor domain-containing protein
MIRCLARRNLWIAIAVVCSHRASALDPDRAMSQYIRDRWGSDKGLAGEVHAITQTDDGYLWIGTERGLFQFDGLSFRPISDQGPSSIANPNVVGLNVSRRNLFVRLPERNLFRYANGTFKNILNSLEPRELAVTAMCRGQDGDLLVSGLVNGVLRYRDGRFETVIPVTSLPPSPIISMTQSADGKVWLGTREAGVFYLNGSQVVAVRTALGSRKINSLLSAGVNVWIGTDSGIVRWNGTGITTEGVPLSLRQAPALALLTDRDSNLWVGTTSGLFRVTVGRASALENREPTPGSGVNALFEDREGNLWAGGPWGIERWRETTFVSYGKLEGLPSDRNGPIYVDSDGRTWFAPLEGGLYWLKGGQRVQVTEAGLPGDVVYSISGKDGDLWIGRQRGGLTHLRYRGGEPATETFTQAKGLAQNSVYSVYQSRDGSVWAGTLSGGVSRFRGGKFTTYSIENGLASNTVASILESSDGTMWFATPDGLRALSNDQWRGYTVKDGLPSNEVYCLTEDSKGILWIGTERGLAFLTANRIATLRSAPEPLRDRVFGLAEDRRGWLWVSTSNHIMRVNRDKLLRGVLAEEDLREYAISDGLRSLEGVRRDESVVADPMGRIWFSMKSGLSVVNPARLTSSAIPVIVHIQTIAADNRIIDLRDPARISAPPRRITFTYSGVTLREPDRVRFRYELEEYDSGWSEPTAAREATYTNLGPGTYRFHVIARNSDGVWNPVEAVIGLQVLPLFWQTWWFRLAALFATALGVLALYQLRLRQLTKRLNVRFEERLAERTRIAEELHDTLLQGFLSASMQLHLAVDNLPADSAAKPTLGRVLELMRHVIDEGRNVLQGLRSSQGGPLNLEQTFSQIRQEFNIPDETAFRVIVDGQPCPIHPVSRDEIYRIGREALINAFRHSRANEIDLEIRYSAKQLRLLVRDNGCGIEPHVLESGRDGHWGLAGMRARAERIGGRLRVWSRSSAGTEVELSVPAHVAFQTTSPNRVQRWFLRKRRASG